MTLPQSDKPSTDDLVKDILSDTKENLDYLDTNIFSLKYHRAVITTLDSSTISNNDTTVVTGVGFEPSTIMLFGVNLDYAHSQGIYHASSTPTQATHTYYKDDNNVWYLQNFIYRVGPEEYGVGIIQCYVSATGSDGFTLTWSVSGTCTGVNKMVALCMR